MRSVLYFLFPFLELLDARLLHWYEVATGMGQYRDWDRTLAGHMTAARRWRNADLATKAFYERLRDEHQRLDVIENKSRAVLASAALTVGLAGFVSTNSDVLDGSALGLATRIAALVSFLFLAFAVLASLRVGSMGARWYIDPVDLDRAQGRLEPVDADLPLVPVAVAMAFKDLMADSTLRKERALRIAIGCLRNGLALLMAVIVITMTMKAMGGGRPTPVVSQATASESVSAQ